MLRNAILILYTWVTAISMDKTAVNHDNNDIIIIINIELIGFIMTSNLYKLNFLIY